VLVNSGSGYSAVANRTEVSRRAFTLGAMILLVARRSSAHLASPDERGVTMGSWHTIVRDVEAAKEFWKLLVPNRSLSIKQLR